MKEKTSDLEIIIVTYNSQFWLAKALESLKEHVLTNSRKKITVTVVDNHSDDKTAAFINKEHPDISFVQLRENKGFAAGNNVALSKTTARYAMLVNSDVEFTADSNLDLMIDYMDKNENVGVISPKIVFTNGEIDPACHRGEPSPWVAFTYISGLEKLFSRSKIFGEYHQGYKDLNSIHEVAAVSGAGLMIRTSLLNSVGLMDERFFMYAEDLDWCKRVRENGFSVVYFPQVKLVHHKYKSGIKNSSKKIARQTKRHFYNTMLQYYDKHYRDAYPSFVRAVIKYIVIIKQGAI